MGDAVSLSTTGTVPMSRAYPITASYMSGNGDWILTEPKRIEFREYGLLFEFEFNHSGPSTHVESIILSIAGTYRNHRVTPSDLVRGDMFTFSYLMPY